MTSDNNQCRIWRPGSQHRDHRNAHLSLRLLRDDFGWSCTDQSSKLLGFMSRQEKNSNRKLDHVLSSFLIADQIMIFCHLHFVNDQLHLNSIINHTSASSFLPSIHLDPGSSVTCLKIIIPCIICLIPPCQRCIY